MSVLSSVGISGVIGFGLAAASASADFGSSKVLPVAFDLKATLHVAADQPSLKVDVTCGRRDGFDEIVVCGRGRMDEAMRLHEEDRGFDPDGGAESVLRERRRLTDVSDSGTGSCSTGGAGGWTGCLLKQWRRAEEMHGR